MLLLNSSCVGASGPGLDPTPDMSPVIPLGIMLYPMRVSAALVLGVWFVMQIGSALLSPSEGGGVAWWAHVGGFVAGMLLIYPMRVGAPAHATPRRKGPWG